MLVALVAGMGAAWLIVSYLSHRSSPAAALPLATVAVAATELPMGTTLREEMIEMVPWPVQALPAGAVSDPKSLHGRVAAHTVFKGEPLSDSRLAEKGTGEGLAAVIPVNMRAMTVRVNEVMGVGGFIHPGDQVDVLTTMQVPSERSVSGSLEYRSRIVLENIRVLAVGQHLVAQDAKPIQVPIVTLLVTPEQSERLALAASHGDLQLTMRTLADNGYAATAGISPSELLGVRAVEEVAHRSAVASRTVAAAPMAAQPEVIEILRGDRFEERRMRPKEK